MRHTCICVNQFISYICRHTVRSFANSHFHVVHVLLYLSYVYDIDNDYVEIWAFKNVCLFIIYLLIVVLCVVVFFVHSFVFLGMCFFCFYISVYFILKL